MLSIPSMLSVLTIQFFGGRGFDLHRINKTRNAQNTDILVLLQIVPINNDGIKISSTNVMLCYEDDQNLKYVLDLSFFVFNKLPEDGILMPKHVDLVPYMKSVL